MMEVFTEDEVQAASAGARPEDLTRLPRVEAQPRAYGEHDENGIAHARIERRSSPPSSETPSFVLAEAALEAMQSTAAPSSRAPSDSRASDEPVSSRDSLAPPSLIPPALEIPFDQRATAVLRATPSQVSLAVSTPPSAASSPLMVALRRWGVLAGWVSAVALGFIAALIVSSAQPGELRMQLPTRSLASMTRGATTPIAPVEDGAPATAAVPGIAVHTNVDSVYITLAAEGEALAPVEGPFPRTVSLPAGRYTVVASKADYGPVVRTFELTADEPHLVLRLNLRPTK